MSKLQMAIANPKLYQLIELMKEHPYLPVLPMVNYEVVPDDSGAYWTGSWGEARVDLYLTAKERILFKGQDDSYDVLLHFMDPGKVDNMTMAELDAACDALPWQKAIVVYIETPEE